MKEERENGKEFAHEIKDETKSEMLEYLKKKQGVRDGFSFVQINSSVLVVLRYYILTHEYSLIVKAVYYCCLFPVSIFL